MPYYKWYGVNLEGSIKKGKKFARSLQSLEAELLELDIGMISTRKCLLQKKLKQSAILACIQYMATLLEGGIRLNKALEIVKDSTSAFYLKDILADLQLHLEQGENFAYTLSFYPEIFKPFFISLVEVGQASGTLYEALRHYIDHARYIESVNHKLKAALITPLITFIFFIITSLGLFLFVVPQFEAIFSSFNEPLPYSTQLLFSLRQAVDISFVKYASLALLLSILLLMFIMKKTKVVSLKHVLLVKMVGIKEISILIYRTQVLYMLTILLKKGIRITQALEIVANSLNNAYIVNDLMNIKICVEEGLSLNKSFENSSYFSCLELKSIIKVGEHSGDLVEVIRYSAFFYQQRAYRKLKLITTFIQPIILLILGGLIAALIFALYIPLFTLNTLIS